VIASLTDMSRRLVSLILLPWLATLAAPLQLDIDRSRSFIAIATRKGGILSFAAGHDHGILATDWKANVCFDRENPRGSSVAVSIPTASLRIDTPEARQKAGVKGDPPGAKDVEKIQSTMLGPTNLDAQKYPEITFKTASVTTNGAKGFVLSGPLTIRGVTRTVSVPVVHEGALFSGGFSVNLTDFGIKPESIGGVVNVKDTIEVRLAFEGKLGGSCTPQITR
jgi:polyisoprenoid-binding protein YceI